MHIVLANPGSALLTLETVHSTLLNLLVGLVEGWMVTRYARVKLGRAAGIMILANYVSAFIGGSLLFELSAQFEAVWAPEPPLYHAGRLLALLAVIAFVLAVVLEFPFVLWATSRKSPMPKARADNPVRRRATTFSSRLALCTACQSVTYFGMALLYAGVCNISLLTDTTRVRDTSGLAGGAQGWIYYVTSDTTEVRRCRLDATRDETWATLKPRSFPRLSAIPLADGTICLIAADTGQVGPDITGRVGERSDEPGVFGGFADITCLDFRPGPERIDRFTARWSADYGLMHWIPDESGTLRRGSLNVAFATPNARWSVAYPTVLPSGSVIFQFGPQIVVMDRQKRIGALCMGTSPVVVLDPTGAEAPPPTPAPAVTPPSATRHPAPASSKLSAPR